MKRVTGIGGIFFQANDPAALAAWYQRHLGIDVQPWGGAAFDWTDDAGQPVGGTTETKNPKKEVAAPRRGCGPIRQRSPTSRPRPRAHSGPAAPHATMVAPISQQEKGWAFSRSSRG